MKYALIGCGRIASNHLKAAIANGFEIIAVCDLLKKRMETLLCACDLEKRTDIKRYIDHHELIRQNPDLELISIATDSGSHAQIAMDVLRYNINVIVEKPMALSLKDADMMIHEADQRHLKLSICLQNRFNIAVQKVRDALEAGRFGRLSHGAVCVRWNRDKTYYDQAAWRGKWASDGGALMNQCIHGIDLMQWLLGGNVCEVYGVTKRQFHDYLECEDLGMAVLRFRNGAIATIEGTINVYPANLEETLLICGENGTVRLGGRSANAIDVWNFKDGAGTRNVGFAEEVSNIYGNGHTSLFRDVMQAINEDRKPYVSGQDGRSALELILAIYKSSFSGKPITLPLENCSTIDFTGGFDPSTTVK